MQIIPESHTHDLNEQQLGYLVEKFADRTAFFIETVILPPELGRVKCALVGPTVGDAPIEDHEVFFAKRGDRQYDSRMISPSKVVTHMVREVTVIAGPHDGKPCVLYAAYGGPLAPKEPTDPTLEASKLDEFAMRYTELIDLALRENRGPTEAEVTERLELTRKVRAISDSKAFWRDHALIAEK